MAIFAERCGGSFGVEVFLVRCTYWIYPHLVAVTNKGLQGFHSENVIVLVVTEILGGKVDPMYST